MQHDTSEERRSSCIYTCDVSVEHVSLVNQRAAPFVGVQDVHQFVPLLHVIVCAIAWAFGNLELSQVQSSLSVNDRVVFAALDDALQVTLCQEAQGRLCWGTLRVTHKGLLGAQGAKCINAFMINLSGSKGSMQAELLTYAEARNT